MYALGTTCTTRAFDAGKCNRFPRRRTAHATAIDKNPRSERAKVALTAPLQPCAASSGRWALCALRGINKANGLRGQDTRNLARSAAQDFSGKLRQDARSRRVIDNIINTS